MTLLNALEVAALLRVDKNTVYRMAQRGDLPCVRVSKAYRFPADGIAAFVSASGAQPVISVTPADLRLAVLHVMDTAECPHHADVACRACVAEQLVAELMGGG